MADDIELLSIGDASIDTFLTPTDTEAQCKIDTKECLICFEFGDKILVKSLEFSSGGNAANNAVGVSRLGIKSGLLITLGDDSVGNEILHNLEKEHVDLTYAFQQKETRSNYSTVINYSGERTIFVYHAPRSYEYPVELPSFPWAYLTSMGENFEPFYNHISDWIKKNPDTKLCFNPGSWQFRAGTEKLKNILASTYIIFVNKQEAEKLTGIKSETDGEKELLTNLSKLGPKISVITDGENGSFAYDGKRYLKVGILPVNAFERTGAGDAFGSGFISALIKGKTIDEAMLWGLSNSASVVGYTGPQRGLLRDSEMPMWLDRCKSSGVKVEEF
jgi:sugar/nucleoside kinase (ribokinase family)